MVRKTKRLGLILLLAAVVSAVVLFLGTRKSTTIQIGKTTWHTTKNSFDQVLKIAQKSVMLHQTPENAKILADILVGLNKRNHKSIKHRHVKTNQ